MGREYIIKTVDGDIFCGWDKFGKISMRSKEINYLSYRMNVDLAYKTLPKIEAFTGKKCEVIELPSDN